jgi:hypothetical protein
VYGSGYLESVALFKPLVSADLLLSMQLGF